MSLADMKVAPPSDGGDTSPTVTALPPSPVEPAHSRSFVAGIVVGVAIVAAAALVVYLFTREDGGATAAPPSTIPTALPTPSPSPTPAKVPVRERAQVKALFSEQQWSKGRDMLLYAYEFPQPDEGCTVHAFAVGGQVRGAYETGCSSWERDGYDVLLFYVALRNVDDRAASFNLRDFVLVSRNGRTFGPVNVRTQAEFPPNFLPETSKMPPNTNVVGYLTFDGRVKGLVPARLSYIDGRQTLTVVFDGKHRVV